MPRRNEKQRVCKIGGGGGQIRCNMGDVQGAYVKNCANFQKGARFKIRLENRARTRVRFISPRRRAKTAYMETSCNSI